MTLRTPHDPRHRKENTETPCPWCGEKLVLFNDVCRCCGKDPLATRMQPPSNRPGSAHHTPGPVHRRVNSVNDSQDKAYSAPGVLTRMELAQSHARLSDRVAELEEAIVAVLRELTEDSGGLTTPTYIAARQAVQKTPEP